MTVEPLEELAGYELAQSYKQRGIISGGIYTYWIYKKEGRTAELSFSSRGSWVVTANDGARELYAGYDRKAATRRAKWYLDGVK